MKNIKAIFSAFAFFFIAIVLFIGYMNPPSNSSTDGNTVIPP